MDNIGTTGTTLSGYNGTHFNLLKTESFEKKYMYKVYMIQFMVL